MRGLIPLIKFFNMYSEFIDKNLKEYYKILATIETCQNEDQFETINNMFLQFGRNCDFRLGKLRKIYTYNQYNKYKHLIEAQIQDIANKSKEWHESYNEWVQEQQRLEEEIKDNPESIRGYSCLFKKHKKK